MTRNQLLVFAVSVVWGAASGASAQINPASRYQIEFGTFLGGTQGEEVREPVLLSGGRLLFGLGSESRGLWTSPGAVQSSYGGGNRDAYLAILNADGSDLEAATYFGGNSMERPPYGIAVHPSGDFVVTGATASPNLPTTAGAWRRNIVMPIPSPGEGYAIRISPDLRTLRWCTYLNGAWPRGGLGLAGSNIVITGRTTSSSYTTTPGAYSTASPVVNDVAVIKLRGDGSAPVFASRFGGGSTTVGESAPGSARVDASGNIYVAGIATSTDFPTTAGVYQPTFGGGSRDLFFAKLNASGTSLLYSTFVGGSDGELAEHPLALLADGSVLLPGVHSSSDFPTTSGAFQRTYGGGSNDAQLVHLEPDGTGLRFSTRIGWSGEEVLTGTAVLPGGDIVLVGNTSSTSVPTSADALQRTYAGGPRDGLVVIVSADGSTLRWLSYIGGSGDELVRGVALGPAGELYLVGRTNSPDFPSTVGAYQTSLGGDDDGFIVKLTPSMAPPPDAGIPSDAGTCVADCTGRSCGGDGCGGSCGTCSGTRSCNAAGACVCSGSATDCDGSCVDVRSDPMHCGTCGTACIAEEQCIGATCTVDAPDAGCVPFCDGRSCGDDGCGGACGVCSTDEICTAGMCECADRNGCNIAPDAGAGGDAGSGGPGPMTGSCTCSPGRKSPLGAPIAALLVLAIFVLRRRHVR